MPKWGHGQEDDVPDTHGMLQRSLSCSGCKKAPRLHMVPSGCKELSCLELNLVQRDTKVQRSVCKS